MNNFIDLHTHSTCSDGSYTPKELISHGKSIGLYAIALTDHDNIDGLKEADEEAKKLGIKFIPGIELNCDFNSELHIVGLNVDIKNKALCDKSDSLKKARVIRNRNTIKRLNDIGLDVTLEDAKKHCIGNVLGRAHIARALVDKGYVATTKEAFSKYLGKGKPGYSRESRISVYDAIKLIKESGGVSILAHCHYLNMENEEFEEYICHLKSHGLDGLEGYYTEYTDEQSEYYISVAKKYGLLISGGSDFHGSMKPNISLGSGYGNLKVPKELLEKIL